MWMIKIKYKHKAKILTSSISRASWDIGPQKKRDLYSATLIYQFSLIKNNFADKYQKN